jgi:hypothetical protein
MARRPFMENTMSQPAKRVKGTAKETRLGKAGLEHHGIDGPRLIIIYISRLWWITIIPPSAV